MRVKDGNKQSKQFKECSASNAALLKKSGVCCAEVADFREKIMNVVSVLFILNFLSVLFFVFLIVFYLTLVTLSECQFSFQFFIRTIHHKIHEMSTNEQKTCEQGTGNSQPDTKVREMRTC